MLIRTHVSYIVLQMYVLTIQISFYCDINFMVLRYSYMYWQMRDDVVISCYSKNDQTIVRKIGVYSAIDPW
jgi:hypothetical protein